MRKTLLQKAIESGINAGYAYVGTVNKGLYSTSKGSNIRTFLDDHGVVVDDVIIYRGPEPGNIETMAINGPSSQSKGE